MEAMLRSRYCSLLLVSSIVTLVSRLLQECRLIISQFMKVSVNSKQSSHQFKVLSRPIKNISFLWAYSTRIELILYCQTISILPIFLIANFTLGCVE